MWRDESPEPEHWQVDCYDESPRRIRSGTVGLWSYSKGRKLYRDLCVSARENSDEGDFLEKVVDGRLEVFKLWKDDADFVLTRALRKAPASPYRILLSHYPDVAPWAEERGVDLVLSGDTHGGQITIPRIGPVYAKSEFQRKYSSGLFQFGSTKLVVSRGIGWNILPLRVYCPPEIITIVFKA